MDKMTGDMMFKSLTGYPDQVIQTIPNLANATTLTAAVGGLYANGYGAAATLLAAASNTTRKKILAIIPSAASAADEFQIALYEGTTLKAEVPYTVDTAVGVGGPISFSHPVIIDAGNDIKAKVACKGAVQRTLDIKLIAEDFV